MARRLVLAAFGVVLLFACATRFWRLDEVGLWYDELWSVVGASDRPLSEVYREWMMGDPHPPGYFLFFFAWFKVFPNDELWSRLPSALAGVATVAYVLFGARKTLSLDERVLCAGFVATSHAFVLYALTAKQYAAMLLWATVATVSYLELAERRRFDRGLSALFFGALTALAWLNYFATVYAALLGVLALWAARRERDELRRGLRWTALTALVCSPLLWFQYLMLRYTPGDWQHDSFAELARDFLPHLFFNDPTVPYFAAGLAVAVAVALALQPAARAGLRTPRNARLFVVLAGVLGFLLLAGVFKPVFFIRYFLVVFPALLLAVGVLAAAAFPLQRWWLTLVPLVFLARAAVAEFRHADALARQQWDKSVDLVLGAQKPDDVVLVLGASQSKTMFEYLQAGDEWSLYYVRNLSFYRYYFRRRGAEAVAQRLEVVGPSVEAARELVTKYRGSGRTVWVLGGHHIKLTDEAIAELQANARAYEFTQLFSTRVYRASF
jgi:4-amino-4-deoxy-L-arabinose transferase-like glycosyltransferase